MGTVACIRIVDDDESLRNALSRLLRLHGYETEVFASAGEFLMKKNSNSPGCMLLDIRMPGPSGLELQEALRIEANSLPVVFLTGRGDIPTTVRALKAGALDFLTKPVKTEELLAAVTAPSSSIASNAWCRKEDASCRSATTASPDASARSWSGSLRDCSISRLPTSSAPRSGRLRRTVHGSWRRCTYARSRIWCGRRSS